MPKNMINKLPMPAAEVAPALVGRGQSSPTKEQVQNVLSNVRARQQALKAAQAQPAMQTIATSPQADAMQLRAEQKMPPPNLVNPANAVPMAPPPAGAAPTMKRGGSVRNKPVAKFSSGGSTSKASSRGDGIAQRGKTKGRYI